MPDFIEVQLPNAWKPGERLRATTSKGISFQFEPPPGCQPNARIKVQIPVPASAKVSHGIANAEEECARKTKAQQHFLNQATHATEPVRMQKKEEKKVDKLNGFLKWDELREMVEQDIGTVERDNAMSQMSKDLSLNLNEDVEPHAGNSTQAAATSMERMSNATPHSQDLQGMEPQRAAWETEGSSVGPLPTLVTGYEDRIPIALAASTERYPKYEPHALERVDPLRGWFISLQVFSTIFVIAASLYTYGMSVAPSNNLAAVAIPAAFCATFCGMLHMIVASLVFCKIETTGSVKSTARRFFVASALALAATCTCIVAQFLISCGGQDETRRSHCDVMNILLWVFGGWYVVFNVICFVTTSCRAWHRGARAKGAKDLPDSGSDSGPTLFEDLYRDRSVSVGAPTVHMFIEPGTRST